VSPVKYEMGFYMPEDDILRSNRREKLKSYISTWCLFSLLNMFMQFYALPLNSVLPPITRPVIIQNSPIREFYVDPGKYYETGRTSRKTV
jgi:hypothetical protein